MFVHTCFFSRHDAWSEYSVVLQNKTLLHLKQNFVTNGIQFPVPDVVEFDSWRDQPTAGHHGAYFFSMMYFDKWIQMDPTIIGYWCQSVCFLCFFLSLIIVFIHEILIWKYSLKCKSISYWEWVGVFFNNY